MTLPHFHHSTNLHQSYQVAIEKTVLRELLYQKKKSQGYIKYIQDLTEQRGSEP